MLKAEDIFEGMTGFVPVCNLPGVKNHDFDWYLGVERGENKNARVEVVVKKIPSPSSDLIWVNPYYGKLLYVERVSGGCGAQYVPLVCFDTNYYSEEDGGQYNFKSVL